MLKTLRSLIGTARKPDVTSAEIETALAGARAEITAAEQAKADAEKAYKAGLLALNDEQADALMATMELAARNRDRAIAVVEALTERLGETRAAEDQAGRRTRYEAAAKAQAAAAKVLAAEYPKLARALVEVLRTVAAADVLAEAANQDLPDGVESLTSVETRVRTEKGEPARITAQEDFSTWCRLGGTRLHPDDAPQVKPNPDGHTGIWKPIGGDPVPVVLHRFRRITHLSDAPGLRASTLASTLNLPGLRAAHSPFWLARDDIHRPASIVAAIEASAANWGQARGRTVMWDPTTHVEIVPLDEPASAAA